MLNQAEKNYCNYQPQFTGKGLKIALIEYYPSTWFYKKNIGNPLNANWKPLLGDDVVDNNHPYQTGSLIRDMLPEAQIDYLPQNNEGINYAIKNGYHIASFSALEMMADDSLEKILSNRTFLVCGAGNSGIQGESVSSSNPWWWSVGAIHYENMNNLAYYSSYGKGYVDSISFSHINTELNGEHYIGTSFSCPFFVGLIGQFYQAYFLKFGFYPYPDEVRDFILENSKPVLNDKLKEGNGILILPDFNTYNFGTAMQIDNSEINVNGTRKIFAPPLTIQITNASGQLEKKSYAPLGVFREIGKNSGKVYYHSDDKRIIIR